LPGPVQAELPIVNLDCATCVVTIQRTLEKMDGVHKAVVNFATAKAFVEYDPAHVTLDDMTRAVKKAGYTVGGTSIRLGIEGLRCASCVGFIEEALRTTPGVLRASVNVGSGEATVDYLPGMTSLSQLKAAIASTGYTAVKALSDEPVDAEREAREQEYRELRTRFVVAGVLAAAVSPGLRTLHPRTGGHSPPGQLDHPGRADHAGAVLVGQPLLRGRLERLPPSDG